MNWAGAFGSMKGMSEGLPGIPLCEVNYTTNVVRSMLDPDSAYMEGLRFLFEANQAGIVDPDSITQRWDNSQDKTEAGRVFYHHWEWASVRFDSAERLNADDPVGFLAIPFIEDYAPVTYENNPIGRVWSVSISSSSNHIEKALAWVDYIANVDNSMTFYNGPQGFLWDIGDDGMPYTTEQGYEFRLDAEGQMPGGGRLRDGFEVINYWPLGWGNMSEKYGAAADHRTWPHHQVIMTALEERAYAHTGFPDNVTRTYAIGNTTPQPLAQMLMPPPPEDIQMLAVRIGDVVQPNSWLAIFADNEAEFNRIINQMRDTAEGLGMADLVAYAEQAWAAALAQASQYVG
jgi:putative aldouronate transport system substrate-binding protein